MCDAEETRALVAALKILSRRDYFRAELADRLGKKDFQASAVHRALGRCSEMGYLDDSRLATRFAELRAPSRGWGPARIRAELGKRGVEEAIAINASELSEVIFEQALTTALRRAEVRARDDWWKTREGRSRMISSLLRRGFEPEDAHKSVGRLCKIREAADHAINDQPGDPEGIS